LARTRQQGQNSATVFGKHIFLQKVQIFVNIFANILRKQYLVLNIFAKVIEKPTHWQKITFSPREQFSRNKMVPIWVKLDLVFALCKNQKGILCYLNFIYWRLQSMHCYSKFMPMSNNVCMLSLYVRGEIKNKGDSFNKRTTIRDSKVFIS
jgi:hypothetical protein